MISARTIPVPLGHIAIDFVLSSQMKTERWIIVQKSNERHTVLALLILLKNPAILSCYVCNIRDLGIVMGDGEEEEAQRQSSSSQSRFSSHSTRSRTAVEGIHSKYRGDGASKWIELSTPADQRRRSLS